MAESRTVVETKDANERKELSENEKQYALRLANN